MATIKETLLRARSEVSYSREMQKQLLRYCAANGNRVEPSCFGAMHSGGVSELEHEWLANRWQSRVAEVNWELMEWHYDTRTDVDIAPLSEVLANLYARIDDGYTLDAFTATPLRFTPGIHDLRSPESAAVLRVDWVDESESQRRSYAQLADAQPGGGESCHELRVEVHLPEAAQLKAADCEWLARDLEFLVERSQKETGWAGAPPERHQADAMEVSFIGCADRQGEQYALNLDRCFALRASVGSRLPRGPLEQGAVDDLARRVGVKNVAPVIGVGVRQRMEKQLAKSQIKTGGLSV